MAAFKNLVILALAMCSSALAASPEFAQWMGQHDIAYESVEEVEYRFGIWRANKHRRLIRCFRKVRDAKII